MASLCKRQQCTIDRRGFRQELDSWRHKLIHCVGFESILEGLFGEELIEDLKLFKDCEPDAVSDWSFDENCVFCCLRRDKVKEHLINLSNEGLEDTPKPLLVKDQTTLSRLERQAEEFLSAVLRRKDVPNFSDPHVPVVAREILQRMIRQFAAEYTSKTSPSQDSCSDHSDQSLPPSQSLSGAPPSTSPAATLAVSAHNQNPVLSKLLMADQEAPLDLTIKKPLAEPTEQDGVLDLSIKKNRNSSNIPVRSPCLSPATSTVKGESTDLRVTKAKDLQSTSTLEQFMAKLCLHHQRQIVDAIGFLQTEVKALASSTASSASNPTSGILGTAFPTAKSSAVTPDRSCAEQSFPSESTSKSEIQDISNSNPSRAIKRTPDQAVISPKTSVPALNLPQTRSGTIQALVSPTTNPADVENNRHGDHAPLKMKIMKTSNVTAGNKLSCVLTTSLSSHSNTLEDRQGNSTSSTKTEMHSARLSSSLKRHNQASHTHQVRQRETIGHAKDTPAKLYAFHVSIPSDSPRTARKTIKASSDLRNRDSTGRGIIDPDLGHCDIVYIDKPITECLKEKHRNMLPRRNARKSTRGHMYAEETWELKTVRTLAGRGNCPNPMPEFITSVTPKQILSKPEGVPPVDMPFAVECREAVNQQTSTEESDESVLPGTGDMVETAVSEADVIVETSQTDQSQSKGQPGPPSPISSPAENIEPDVILEHTTSESGKAVEKEESVAPTSINEEEKDMTESQDATKESVEQVVSETVSKPLGETMSEPLGDNNIAEVEPQLPLEKNDNVPVPQQIDNPSPVHEVEEETGKNERENVQDEQPQGVEVQSETIMKPDNLGEIEESRTTDSAVEEKVKEQEVKTSETDHTLESVDPENNDDDDDDDGGDYDVSAMTMDALSKELLPWRRKKGTVISLPKRMRQTEAVIVGYVNGRPVSASDRSLRRRSSSSISPHKTPEKSRQNVLKATSVESGVESSNLEKCVPQTNTPVSSPVNPPVTEPSSDTPSSPASKVPSRTKQKRVKKQQENTLEQSVDSLNTETKRSLRSASQKPETLVAPLTSNISISSPKPSVASDLPSTEQVPSLPSSSPPLPVSSPPLVSSSPRPPTPPVTAEESQPSSVQETTVDSNTEKTQQAEKFNEVQKSEIESRLQAKQKLRSGKVITDVSKTEKAQISSDVPLENQSSLKTEVNTPIVPGRVKRVLHKEAEASNLSVQQMANVASLGDKSVSGDGSKSSTSEKPTRMPLRSESSKAELSQQSLCQSPPVEDRKLALRSQRQAAPSTSSPSSGGRQGDVASPIRMKPERPTKAQTKPSPAPVASVQPHSSAIPVNTPRSEPPKQTANKFYQSLTGEENQHIITNLNIKYDKMQKGWVQMDKEGQPAPKYKNKADRQAAIWKSKRRTRKPKSSDHQKYSPVQMLFMKGFDLTSICRWFLESTETKSLVIVKKVNTRLPSETQLCFHSSSSTSGTSQGVFPSLQAERLKKHLKKFAIASPVKSNPKSQKLIARALEQEANAVKGKEKKEISNASTGPTKSISSAKTCVLMSESQKTSGKSKNPASARILRKYSNIREKMQVQQANDRLKDKSKTKATKMKTLTTTKAVSKANLKPSLKPQKSSLRVTKQIKESPTKPEKKKTLVVKKNTKQSVKEKATKTQNNSRPLKDQVKKESPKRVSQRLGSPKAPESNADTSKSKGEKKVETEKAEEEKPTSTKVNAGKVQSKEPPSTVVHNKSIDNAVETPQQCTDVKVSNLPDQVLTRSQRKMEATMPSSARPTSGSKRTAKSLATPKAVARAEEPTVTRSGALKSPAKRSQAASLPRSATKRAQELLETPAKRTRTSK
ncbi:proteoglycan 4 isoform X2 [Sphaeramia orbicularis]|uniref:proteoglycan 4 isoform X2 n=1 Tax=Sphaeramia orbicularis TaxID=375764 RepID=UPI0011801A93|nr:proteoglycan 4-like isoform X2 [Sphaeramia orbicularis]